MSDTILTIRGLTKRFPGVTALDDVSFELRKGEVHALCGENGAGKSTLIKILTGLYDRDCGEIVFEGSPVRFKSVQECRSAGISLIPQEIHLAQTLTVAENICMSDMPHNRLGVVRWKEMREKAASLIKRVGGAAAQFTPDTLVGSLSMGQQQLVEIIKAVSTDLKVIAFDEPTSSLSDEETESLFALIRELTEKGISIIYVSHRLQEIFRICDRVTVLKDGRYVNTEAVGDVTMDEVVSMMVGRDMERYVKRRSYAQPEEAVLQTEHLRWGDRVRDVSFQLHKGEILGMFGIVGSGRTETARILFGLQEGASGEIALHGQPVRINSPEKAVQSGIGFVTEDRRGEGLSLVSSVKWNISMPFLDKLVTRFKRIRHAQENKRTAQLAEKLNIRAPSLDTAAESLSGGNQQKVVVAKWLGAASEILVFDEPTRGIDVGAKAEIYRLMEELAAQGKSIIMISSELPELMALSDRILVFRDGEIVHEFEDVRGLTEEDILRYAIMNIEGEVDR